MDMQNFSSKREWKMIGTEGTGTSVENSNCYYGRLEKIVIPNIKKLLNFYRKNKLDIIHVRVASYYENYCDVPNLWRLRLYQHERDSGQKYNSYYKNKEMQIIDELKPINKEIEIIKTTGNAFTSTNLDFILKNGGIKSFIAVGSWLNSCLEDTVRVGADLGYLITILEDCVIAPDKKFHDSAIRVLGSMYCNIKSSEEVIDLFKKFLKFKIEA
ncbi:MAG: cysteine hydrolase family protein [Candidatus Humimicrobiaceae bacterium]